MGSFFSFDGRLNRLRYFVESLLINLAGSAIIFGGAALINAQIGWGAQAFFSYAAVISLLQAVMLAFPVVRRFHDLNRPGSHYWLLLLPLYNLYLGLVLLFKKGTEGPNQYGADPLELRVAIRPEESTPLAFPLQAPVAEFNDPANSANSDGRGATMPEEAWVTASPPVELEPINSSPSEEAPVAERGKTLFHSVASAAESALKTSEPGKPAAQTRKIVGFLVTYTWRADGEVFPVREGRNLIGRDEEQCDIAVLADSALSAVNTHITFRRRFVIGDMMSMGGTSVEGQPVEVQFHPLPNYAKIRTGSTQWTFVAIDPVQAAESKPE